MSNLNLNLYLIVILLMPCFAIGEVPIGLPDDVELKHIILTPAQTESQVAIYPYKEDQINHARSYTGFYWPSYKVFDEEVENGKIMVAGSTELLNKGKMLKHEYFVYTQFDISPLEDIENLVIKDIAIQMVSHTNYSFSSQAKYLPIKFKGTSINQIKYVGGQDITRTMRCHRTKNCAPFGRFEFIHFKRPGEESFGDRYTLNNFSNYDSSKTSGDGNNLRLIGHLEHDSLNRYLDYRREKIHSVTSNLVEDLKYHLSTHHDWRQFTIELFSDAQEVTFLTEVKLIIYYYQKESKNQLIKEKSLGKPGSTIDDPGISIPINFSTGNFYKEEKNFTMFNSDFPLKVTLHYNSQSEENNKLGYGWSHSYSKKLKFDPHSEETKVTLLRSNGRAEYYIYDIDKKKFINEFKKVSVITKINNNNYELIESDGTKTIFNKQGQMTSISNLKGNKHTITYVKNGIKVTDNDGNKIQFFYSGDGKLIDKLETPVGNFDYKYDENDNLFKVTKPNNTTREYRYKDIDDKHNLTHVVNELGKVELTVGYDSKDRANVEKLGEGGMLETTIKYDSSKEDREVIDSLGRKTPVKLKSMNGVAFVQSTKGGVGGATLYPPQNSSFEFKDTDRMLISKFTTGKGLETHLGHDIMGNISSKEIVSSSSGESQKTSLFWDKNNLLEKTVTKGLYQGEYVKSFDRDEQTGILKQYSKKGQNFFGDEISRTLKFRSNGPNNQLTEIDGARTDVDDRSVIKYYKNSSDVYKYNKNKPHTIISPAGFKTTINKYNNIGLPEEILTKNGITIKAEYDYDGKIKKRTVNNLTSEYKYTKTGKIKEYITHNNKGNLSFEYDQVDFPREVIDQVGNYITYKYNNAAKITDIQYMNKDKKDKIFQHINYKYNENDKLKTINYPITEEYPDGISEYIDYDKGGNISMIQDGNGNKSSYEYDDYNRLKKIILNLDNNQEISTLYNYDKRNNLQSITDFNNNKTTYHNDDFGRANKIESPDTGITIYKHDEAGNVTSVKNAKNNILSYKYDQLNRLTKVTFNQKAQNFYYYYDNNKEYDVINSNGKLWMHYYWAGGERTYYNEFGMITQSKHLFRNWMEKGKYQDINLDTRYEYYGQGSGAIKKIIYPSGLEVTYQRYDNNQISGIEANSSIMPDKEIVTKNITYMPLGPEEDFIFGDNIKVDKTYMDSIYLLKNISVTNTKSSKNYLNYRYSHDKAMNIRSIEGLPIPKMSSSSKTYEYKNHSNLIDNVSIEDAKISFSYDKNGNLTSDGLLGYEYNDNNRLSLVYNLENHKKSTSYYYNGYGERVRKDCFNDNCTNKKTVQTIYVYSRVNGNLLYENNGQEIKEYIYQNDNLVAINITKKKKSKIYYVINDHLATPQQIIDSGDGEVVWKASYLPYGRARIEISKITNNIRFKGQYYDRETALHYNLNRYYNPTNGRYITADPLGLAAGINLFAYVENDPINNTDPEGLRTVIGYIVKSNGFKKIKKLTSIQAAAKARRKGLDVLAKNKPIARKIEIHAFGTKDLQKHKGHKLKDINRVYPKDKYGNETGEIGLSHYQQGSTDIWGHTYWGEKVPHATLMNKVSEFTKNNLLIPIAIGAVIVLEKAEAISAMIPPVHPVDVAIGIIVEVHDRMNARGCP